MYTLFVTVNLPQHKEAAFQLSEVSDIHAAVARADIQYPTWTSLDVKVIHADLPVGEPA
jgi:hypothetical protein